MINYYDILKIDRNSQIEEIRSAIRDVRRKVRNRETSPDLKIRQEAEKLMSHIAEAEKILLDETKRKQYDINLENYFNNDNNANSGNEYNSSGNEYHDYGGLSKEDYNSFVRAEMYFNRRQFDLAYRQIKELRTATADVLFAKSKYAYFVREYADFQISLDKFVEKNPGAVATYVKAAGLCSELKEHDRALEYYEEALQIKKDTSIEFEIINIYLDKQNYFMASQKLSGLRNSIGPADSGYYYYMNYLTAYCYNRMNEPNNSIQYSKLCFDDNYNEHQSGALYEYIVSYRDMKRLDEILPAVEAAYRNNPNEVMFTNAMAGALYIKYAPNFTTVKPDQTTVLGFYKNEDIRITSSKQVEVAKQLLMELSLLKNINPELVTSLKMQIEFAEKWHGRVRIGQVVKYAFVIWILNYFLTMDAIEFSFLYDLLMPIALIAFFFDRNIKKGYRINYIKNKKNIIKKGI